MKNIIDRHARNEAKAAPLSDDAPAIKLAAFAIDAVDKMREK